MSRTTVFVLLVAIGLGVGTGRGLEAQPSKVDPGSVQAVTWKDLVPPGYDPDRLLKKYYDDVANLSDSDPRAQRLAAAVRKAWENAPVVEALNNKMVKLSGFLVTLEGDGKAVSEFLLVPFFGACLHVPPPPSNQIVLVRTAAKPFKIKHMFETVAVTGRLRTQLVRNDLASASYVMEATHVEPQGN
ncbi:MAG TPA: DUF3299 domain-containing protein [Methylomirabilota bacterium]|nr:DUF3299 domain-containing protein [Methylomirabilota bacterium]